MRETKKLAPDVLEALGLRPDAELVDVDHARMPEPPRAFGRAERDLTSDAHLLELVKKHPSLMPAELPQLHAHMPDVQIHWWNPDPRVALLEFGPDTALRAHGTLIDTGERAHLVDTRRGPATVRLVQAQQDLVLAFEEGEVWAGQPRTTGHEEGSSLDAPEAPAVDVRALVGTWAVAPWLLAEAEQLAAADWSFARAAAVGLLARLWTPVSPAARNDLLRRLREGDGGPSRAACRWFAALEPATRATVARSARSEVDALTERLPELSALAPAEPDEAEALGLSWLRRRDDLESVFFLLKRAGEEHRLAGELAALDARAAKFRSYWALLEPVDDERLRAVSWQEPDAWWGQLALP